MTKPATKKSASRKTARKSTKKPAKKSVQRPAKRSAAKTPKRVAQKASAARKRAAPKKSTPARRPAKPARAAARRIERVVTRPEREARRGLDEYQRARREAVGTGLESGGQSGDIEGLSAYGTADSQSVVELLEEGQSYEAGIVSGVEEARNADEGGVRTREVPEDDVPPEYLDQ